MTDKELLETIARDVLDLKRDIIDIKRAVSDLAMHSPMRLGKTQAGLNVASDKINNAPIPVKVMGIVLAENKKPLQGVAITIYDGATSAEIGKAISSETGEWNITVPKSGSYSIEYLRGGKAPHNINIIIPSGVTSYQIARGR
jgi:hypothetical protein